MGTIIVGLLLFFIGIPVLIITGVVVYSLVKMKQETKSEQFLVDEMSNVVPADSDVTESLVDSSTNEDDGVIYSVNFPVVGLNYEGRRKLLTDTIKQYKADEYFFMEPYEGMSNKEILENTFDERIYELNYESLPVCRLVKEDNNEYDPNAIMIIIEDDFGQEYHIGYVPREHCSSIRNYMDEYDMEIINTITGGKYKVVDYDDTGEEKVRVRSVPYGLNVSVIFNE